MGPRFGALPAPGARPPVLAGKPRPGSGCRERGRLTSTSGDSEKIPPTLMHSQAASHPPPGPSLPGRGPLDLRKWLPGIVVREETPEPGARWSPRLPPRPSELGRRVPGGSYLRSDRVCPNSPSSPEPPEAFSWNLISPLWTPGLTGEGENSCQHVWRVCPRHSSPLFSPPPLEMADPPSGCPQFLTLYLTRPWLWYKAQRAPPKGRRSAERGKSKELLAGCGFARSGASTVGSQAVGPSGLQCRLPFLPTFSVWPCPQTAGGRRLSCPQNGVLRGSQLHRTPPPHPHDGNVEEGSLDSALSSL